MLAELRKGQWESTFSARVKHEIQFPIMKTKSNHLFNAAEGINCSTEMQNKGQKWKLEVEIEITIRKKSYSNNIDGEFSISDQATKKSVSLNLNE